MATSETFDFNLDLSDAIEEAFERAGLELRSGYDYRTARRSIDLLSQVPHCDLISTRLQTNARLALKAINRFPVSESEDLEQEDSKGRESLNIIATEINSNG